VRTAIKTRNAAIITMRKWVPENEALTTVIKAFAIALLKRLAVAAPTSPADITGDDEVESAEPKPAPKAPCAEVVNAEVTGELPPPTTEAQVSQHLDLLLGVSINAPDLLDE
jgi:symplekin